MDIESLFSVATVVAPFLGGGAVIIVTYAKKLAFAISVVQQAISYLNDVSTPNSVIRADISDRGYSNLLKAIDGGVAKVNGLKLKGNT